MLRLRLLKFAVSLKKLLFRGFFFGGLLIGCSALRISDSSYAPSSYQNKRARISAPLPTPSQPREASSPPKQGAASSPNHGSWSSRSSSRATPHRTPSRAASSRSATQSQSHHHQQQQQQQLHRASSDRR